MARKPRRRRVESERGDAPEYTGTRATLAPPTPPLRRDAAPPAVVTRPDRPRCGRCDGWLYVESAPTPDGCVELACVRCGGRSYVDVKRLR